MKVADIIKSEKPSLSFEVFPPKTDAVFESIRQATEDVAALKPDYMSVTYGAGGGTSEHTVAIAANLEKRFHVPVVAHISCISSTKEGVHRQLEAMKAAGLTNVLALRGDIPEGGEMPGVYAHASDLIPEIMEAGDFCVGCACYPEGHPESPNQKEDILHLKDKVGAGCSYLVTQMFFDNDVFFNFLYKVREAGITVPVVPGIMPVTNAKQVNRIRTLSGQNIPPRFRYIVDRFGEDPAAMAQAGIAFATQQIVDLYANGINAVHVYSMNNARVAGKIKENLSQIVK